MVDYQLLIRTILAARQARKTGHIKTADALDILVKMLSKHLDAEFLITSAARTYDSAK